MIPIIGINMLARGKDKKLYTEFCTGFFIWRQFIQVNFKFRKSRKFKPMVALIGTIMFSEFTLFVDFHGTS